MKGGEKLNKIIIAVVILGLLVGSVAAVLIIRSFTIRNLATIKTFNLQCDTTAIDWGVISAGDSAQHIINVEAVGNTPVTLSMNVTNFNPSIAAQYITLTWNYTGTLIQNNTWTPLNLNLAVAPNPDNVTTFSFDINITGTA